MGCSVSGTDDWDGMASELVPKIAAVLEQQSGKLLPQTQNVKSVYDLLQSAVKGRERKVFISVKEDISVSVPDPAAETELKKLLLQLGFRIVDFADDAEFVVRGEAVASQAGSYHKFTSASARVELSVFDGKKNCFPPEHPRRRWRGRLTLLPQKMRFHRRLSDLQANLFRL